MITNLNIKRFSGFIMLLILLPLVSFKNEKKTSTGCLLVVGVAYKDHSCMVNDVSALKFPTVKGSYYVSGHNTDAYYENVNLVKEYLQKEYKVPYKDISIYSSEMQKGVIIEYRQKIPDWNCSVYKFIVGFGDTEEDALADAVKQKNEAAGYDTPYKKKAKFGCKY